MAEYLTNFGSRVVPFRRRPKPMMSYFSGMFDDIGEGVDTASGWIDTGAQAYNAGKTVVDTAKDLVSGGSRTSSTSTSTGYRRPDVLLTNVKPTPTLGIVTGFTRMPARVEEATGVLPIAPTYGATAPDWQKYLPWILVGGLALVGGIYFLRRK